MAEKNIWNIYDSRNYEVVSNQIANGEHLPSTIVEIMRWSQTIRRQEANQNLR